jgi:hypothetical protein
VEVAQGRKDTRCDVEEERKRMIRRNAVLQDIAERQREQRGSERVLYACCVEGVPHQRDDLASTSIPTPTGQGMKAVPGNISVYIHCDAARPVGCMLRGPHHAAAGI